MSLVEVTIPKQPVAPKVSDEDDEDDDEEEEELLQPTSSYFPATSHHHNRKGSFLAKNDQEYGDLDDNDNQSVHSASSQRSRKTRTPLRRGSLRNSGTARRASTTLKSSYDSDDDNQSINSQHSQLSRRRASRHGTRRNSTSVVLNKTPDKRPDGLSSSLHQPRPKPNHDPLRSSSSHSTRRGSCSSNSRIQRHVNHLRTSRNRRSSLSMSRKRGDDDDDDSHTDDPSMSSFGEEDDDDGVLLLSVSKPIDFEDFSERGAEEDTTTPTDITAISKKQGKGSLLFEAPDFSEVSLEEDILDGLDLVFGEAKDKNTRQSKDISGTTVKHDSLDGPSSRHNRVSSNFFKKKGGEKGGVTTTDPTWLCFESSKHKTAHDKKEDNKTNHKRREDKCGINKHKSSTTSSAAAGTMASNNTTKTTSSAQQQPASGLYNDVTRISCQILIHKGEKLKQKDRKLFGKLMSSNPYVEVWRNLPTTQIGKTATKFSTSSPEYEERFKMSWTHDELLRSISTTQRAKVVLKIWDYDRVTGVGESVGGAVRGSVGVVRGGVGAGIGAVGIGIGAVRGGVGAGIGAVGTVGKTVGGTAVGAMGGALGAVGGAVGGRAGRDMMKGTVDGTVGAVGGAVGAVSGALGAGIGAGARMGGAVTKTGAGLVGKGVGVVGGAVGGAVGVVGGAVGKVGGTVGGIVGIGTKEVIGECTVPVPLPNESDTISKQWFDLVDENSGMKVNGRLQVSIRVKYEMRK